jgi:hypothetical protein
MARWIPQALQDYILNEIAESTEQVMCSQQPATYYNAVRPALWVQNTGKLQGDIVYPPTPNGKVYECTVAGITGAVEPAWGTVQDGTFTDGTVTWKTHDNYALVTRTLVPEDFAISDDVETGGRKLLIAQKMGVVTHTAGIVSHVALLCSTDKSLRFVSVAQTTIGGNEIESGRTTIFYEMKIVVKDPTAS